MLKYNNPYIIALSWTKIIDSMLSMCYVHDENVEAKEYGKSLNSDLLLGWWCSWAPLLPYWWLKSRPTVMLSLVVFIAVVFNLGIRISPKDRWRLGPKFFLLRGTLLVLIFLNDRAFVVQLTNTAGSVGCSAVLRQIAVGNLQHVHNLYVMSR